MPTLCQYYDNYVKKLGYKCWNTFCAHQKELGYSTEWLKKQLKRDYKNLKKETL